VNRRATVWARRAALALILLILLTAVGYAVRQRLQTSPPLILPPDLAALDPDVRSLIQSLAQSVRENPRRADAHGNLGLAYEANEMWHEAERAFANAARLDPREPLWPFHQAICLRQARDFESALAIWNNLAAKRPNLPALYQRLGDALLESGDLDDAERAFQKVIDLAPSAPEGHVGLADVHLRRRNFNHAVDLLQRALKLAPDYKSARYLLGLAYRGLGRAEDSARELAAGADARRRYLPDPLSAQLANYTVNLAALLGDAADLIESGRPQQAAALLERALVTRPDNVDLMNNLASAYIDLNRLDQALNLLRRARDKDPGAFATHINLAACLIKLEQPVRALQHADEAVRLAPDLGRAHLVRARALAALNRFDDALEALTVSLRHDARDPNVHVAAGEMCVLTQRFDQARVHYQTALRMMPDSLPVQVSLGLVCVQLARLDEAADALAAARKISPAHARVRALEQRLNAARASRGTGVSPADPADKQPPAEDQP
jgi:protein O-GlcNAc transferase